MLYQMLKIFVGLPVFYVLYRLWLDSMQVRRGKQSSRAYYRPQKPSEQFSYQRLKLECVLSLILAFVILLNTALFCDDGWQVAMFGESKMVYWLFALCVIAAALLSGVAVFCLQCLLARRQHHQYLADREKEYQRNVDRQNAG